MGGFWSWGWNRIAFNLWRNSRSSSISRNYRRIDIALDPFPYAGGTTTCDALWMGVPTVTLRGRTAVGRGGVSILWNVGLVDWIAGNPAQYVSIAMEKAKNLPRLAELRAGLREQMERSPLMDAKTIYRGYGSGISRDVEDVVFGAGMIEVDRFCELREVKTTADAASLGILEQFHEELLGAGGPGLFPRYIACERVR